MITLAVTAYQETERGNCGWILECLQSAGWHSLVSEIVVMDDGSTDYPQLQKHLVDHPKLSLVHNETNLGVFASKLEAVYHSTNEWVQQCDSDNQMPLDYFDHLYHIVPWQSDTWYLPSFAMPQLDYRTFCGQYDINTVRTVSDQPHFECLMNTGNSFVNRKAFLSVFGKFRGKRFDLELPNYFHINDRSDIKWRRTYDACDSLIYNLLWLQSGGKINVVPGLEYHHRMDIGLLSNYVRSPPAKVQLNSILLSQLQSPQGSKSV